MEEYDISGAFAAAYSENKPEERAPREQQAKRDSYGFYSFDLCRSKGSVLLKWVIDSTPRPYKALDHVYVGSIPIAKDNGEGTYNRALRVCATENYKCELTPDQKALNDELIKEIELNIQLCNDKGTYSSFRNTKKMTIFFAMIRKYTDENGNSTEYADPKITVMVHRSYNFINNFNKAIESRKEAYEGDVSWMSKYFNRREEPNMYFLQIMTHRPNIGYETTFDYLELPNKKFVVKQEDLETALNLDTAFINVLEYDEEFYRDSLERLKMVNAELSGVSGMKTYEPNRQNNN